MADDDDNDDGGGGGNPFEALGGGSGEGSQLPFGLGDANPNAVCPAPGGFSGYSGSGVGGGYGGLRSGFQVPEVISGAFNPMAASNFLANNSHGASMHECAAYVRQALEVGGINTAGHPYYAGDYNGYLQTRGFQSIASGNGANFGAANSGYQPRVGDVAVLQVPGQAGHIAMFSLNREGQGQWISDFHQNEMLCGNKFRNADCNVTIFRHDTQINAPATTVASGARAPRASVLSV